MFVSAQGTVEERMEGYAVGAEDYIVKPFSHDELKSKLMKLKGILTSKKTYKSKLTMPHLRLLTLWLIAAKWAKSSTLLSVLGKFGSPKS